MTSTARSAARPAALPSRLAALVMQPSRVYPELIQRRNATEILFFSAVSGIYVAYVLAQWANLGDAIGFWSTAAGVLVVGSVLGFIALYFAGGLLYWSAEAMRGRPGTDYMYVVFGYATWPFLPLLAVIVPLELVLYGPALFSAARPDAPDVLVWLVRALEIGTIFLWLFLMVKGTAAAAEMTGEKAVETVALSIAEIAVIFVLFALIMLVSLLYW